MRRKICGILRHAFLMVRRNLKSYALLSVTILLSFSLLLGYLGLMDSEHFNRFKYIFSQDRSIVYTQGDGLTASMAELLQRKASEYGDTYWMQTLACGNLELVFQNYKTEDGIPISCFTPTDILSIPKQSWAIWNYDEMLPVTWIDSKNHNNYDLASGEILMDEQLYHALDLDQMGNRIELHLTDYDEPILVEKNGYSYTTWKDHTLECTVVGTIPSNGSLSFEYKTSANAGNWAVISTSSDYKPMIVCSLENLNPAVIEASWIRSLTFYTQTPEQLTELIRSVDSSLYCFAIYESQNQALEIMQTEKATKSMVAAILLLLLGINLYSSFTNALNDRKFEIGVKRAIGASGWSIVRQFFYEGLLVMVVDIVLSVAIVVNIGIIYKFIRESIPDQFGQYEHFVLYISPYSVAIFGVCAVVLTVVFSLLFAYKSTQVQIVDYLKAE